jgi:uncharacterized protein (TIGR03435 family)
VKENAGALPVAACALFAAVAFAQGPPANPAFEVASVKSNPSKLGIRGHAFPGDRFEASNVPARDLIMIAYGDPGQLLPESMQKGGPDWIDVDRFNVTAKAAADADHSVAGKQRMLRALLADRFRLVVHTEAVESPIYLMTLAKENGALGRQLRRSADACGDGDAGSVPVPLQPGQPLRCVLFMAPSGTLLARGQTMNSFAYALSRTLGRAVENRTALSGGFDADAEFNPEGLPDWAPLPAGAPNHDAPSLFEALREQLGLKLEGGRGSVDVLTIDHIEHPTDD